MGDNPTSAADEDDLIAASIPPRRQARRSKRSNRWLIASALLPVVVAIAAFAVTYAVRSGAEVRYGHEVTMATRHDGRVGAWDHRNELAEVLDAEVSRSSTATDDVEVTIATRFNNLIDIEVLAPSPAAASQRAAQLVEFATADRAAAATELTRADLEALQAALEAADAGVTEAEAALAAIPEDGDRNEAQRNLSAAIEQSNSFERQLKQREADLDAAIVPLRVVSDEPTGEVSPEPLRDAALAGAAGALIALAALAAWRPE